MNIEHRKTTVNRSGTGRLQFALIAAVFAIPLALAAWMYYSGSGLAPGSGTNKGVLLLPIVALADDFADSKLRETAADQWLMLYAYSKPCEEECATALIRLRQTRLMLGKDMPRVSRVFLHGESAPDTVDLDRQHSGLIITRDERLSSLIEEMRPTDLPPGGSFLIDPLGNLVMYFPPDLNPKDVVDDIKHLLKLSHIG